MQSPFWKNCDGNQGLILQKDFLDVIKACQSVGILIVVVPLVDHGRIDSAAEEDTLVGFLKEQEEFLINQGVRVAFESDFSPVELVRFIDRFGSDVFGINYDIGNSAALGFDPREEIRTYGDRIINVHIKDRRRGGGTVPLGMGHANFEAAFSELARVGYSGNYILQTARALDGQHENVLCRYRDMVSQWLARYAA